MNYIRKTVSSGKINKGNQTQQSYINISVLLGFILIFIWVQLYKKTFIDVKIVLGLLILPSLFFSIFLFNKYVSICGYSRFASGNTLYNILIRFLVFLLIAMPIGNLTVLTFMYSNQELAPKAINNIIVFPQDVWESTTKNGAKYTSFEISHDGVTKRLRSYEKSAVEIQNHQVQLKVRKGYFGYSFYDRYVLEKLSQW